MILSCWNSPSGEKCVETAWTRCKRAQWVALPLTAEVKVFSTENLMSGIQEEFLFSIQEGENQIGMLIARFIFLIGVNYFLAVHFSTV